MKDMFKKILGVLQIVFLFVISAFIFWKAVPIEWAFIGAAYFIGKGLFFGITKNPLSYLDAFFGMLLLLPIVGIFDNIILDAIAIIFLLQKGVTYLLR